MDADDVEAVVGDVGDVGGGGNVGGVGVLPFGFGVVAGVGCWVGKAEVGVAVVFVVAVVLVLEVVEEGACVEDCLVDGDAGGV